MADISRKAKAIKEWAQSWTSSPSVKLNAVNVEDGEMSVLIDATDNVITQYIDGTAEREYVFALVCVLPWSVGTDDINLQSMDFAGSWFDWVEEQNSKRAFPDFGKAAQINAVRCVENTPLPALVYSDEGVAKYQFFAKVFYTE